MQITFDLPLPLTPGSKAFLEIVRDILALWPEFKGGTDAEIEAALFANIREKLPDAACFGEETSEPFCIDPMGTSFLVDPIDGSHNRARGLPFYSVCVAQYCNSRVSRSLVFIPEWSTIYLALDDRAYKSSPLGLYDISVGPIRPKSDRFISTFKQQLLTADYVPERVRTISCSSIEICLVAQGALDAFVDKIGYEKQCDIAAALHILTLAGGHYCYDCPIDPLSGADPNWLFPRRLIAASQRTYIDEYAWSS